MLSIKNTRKSLIIMTTLILSLSLAIPLMTLSIATATDTRVTYPFCGVIPDHTGVGQGVTLHIGITMQTNHPQEGWEGLTVIVTKPDNTTETLGPFNTDTTGGTGATYVPTLTGTYYFQTHFPNQTMLYTTAGTTAGTMMLSSDSEKTPLYVSDTPVSYYPEQALPSEYWSRPIDSQLREWSVIAGNWLNPQTGFNTGVQQNSNLFAPYNDAPETAHILWSRNDLAGSGAGLVGGNTEHGYYTGDAYEGKFLGSVIIAGVLYYNRMPALSTIQEVVAVDLHTGKELWTQNWNNTRLAFGQILNWEAANGHGSYSYLWTTVGTTWNAYDPQSGTWVFSLSNVPSGTSYYGPNGEILKYSVSNGRLLRWNSTWAVKYWDSVNPYSVYSQYSYIAGHSRLIGTTIDASKGYDLNVSAAGLPGSLTAVFCTGTDNDKAVGWSLGVTQTTVWALSLKKGAEGTLLYNTTWANPSAWITGNQSISWITAEVNSDRAILWSKEMRQYYCINLATGQIAWGPTASQYYMDQYSEYGNTIAYGTFFECHTGGTLYAYNVTNGNLIWSFNATDTYVEYKISPNWWLYIDFISDGKVYVGHAEHSSGDPKPRGAPYYCFNATTGDIIWQIDGAFRQTEWGQPAIIGDSIIATMDTYDQQIYAIGKGPTSTTVTAPNIGVQQGSSIVIQGTVSDSSPGASQDEIKMRFPNGLPVVSDDSMSNWMLYVYKQFARPSNSTGVQVSLDVIDANGNYRNIGTATSDANGVFSYTWKPDIEGQYILYATFMGSKAYYGSFAECSFVVDPVPATPTPAPQAQQSMVDQYFVPAIIGIIVAICLVGIVLALLIKKRP